MYSSIKEASHFYFDQLSLFSEARRAKLTEGKENDKRKRTNDLPWLQITDNT